jgi:aspartate racemase
VAGAGPYAGLDLIKKILEQTEATRDQDHLHIVSWFQPQQLPDRTAYLLGESQTNPAYAIAEQVAALAGAGAAVAAIPCNTAHAAPIYAVVVAELARRGCHIRFLHMIRETAHAVRVRFPTLHTVGLLATTGTVATRLYADILEPLGLHVVVPDAELQAACVQQAIYAPDYGIKALGHGTARSSADLLTAATALRAAGAEALILGCTELPLAITGPTFAALPTIDPTLILARALIRAVNPAKLKPFNENPPP